MRRLVVPALAGLALVGCDMVSSRSEQEKKAPHPGGAVPVAKADVQMTKPTKPGEVARPIAPTVDGTQPEVPPLPDDVGLGTTDVQLGAQALIEAQAEKDAGALGDLAVADRHRTIYLVWLPQMLDRQAFLQQLKDERRAEHERQVADASRTAKHKAELAATEARLARKVEAEKRKTAPILTKEDRDVLE